MSGGVAVGGGEMKEVMSFEAQIMQKFYPGQRIIVATGHFEKMGMPYAAQPGTIVRFCSLRSKFLVDCNVAGSKGIAGLGSAALIDVEYVNTEDLTAEGSRLANVEVVHLHGTHRVAAAAYDNSVAVVDQDPAALWHRAVDDQLHNGITDTEELRELVRRLRYVGDNLFVQSPEVYSQTRFSFMMNRTLEEFAGNEHVRKYDVEEPWCDYPDAGVIFKHTAIRCDENGVPLAPGKRYAWDVKPDGQQTVKPRQYVAGSVALLLCWKVGYELVVGTFPQSLNTSVVSANIAIGKLKGKKLKPGMRIIPIGTIPRVATIAGVEYDGLLVECPDFPEEDGSYPTATLPPLLYSSQSIGGRKEHWIQVCTAHAPGM